MRVQNLSMKGVTKMFWMTDNDIIINVNQITAIYIKKSMCNGIPQGTIMVQFSESADYMDEVALKNYNTVEEAKAALYELANTLGAKKV